MSEQELDQSQPENDPITDTEQSIEDVPSDIAAISDLHLNQTQIQKHLTRLEELEIHQ